MSKTPQFTTRERLFTLKPYKAARTARIATPVSTPKRVANVTVVGAILSIQGSRFVYQMRTALDSQLTRSDRAAAAGHASLIALAASFNVLALQGELARPKAAK